MTTTMGPETEYSAELLQSVEAPHVSIFECISLLIPTASNVALQFRLCQRILQFPLDQVAFWLPELVHVFVTCETESAALENCLVTLSERSTHIALSVFWFLQASLHDLHNIPHSNGFIVARRLSNKMQLMLFTAGELPQETAMHENPQPAMILAGMIGSSVAMPKLGRFVKPIIEIQGRKQRSAYLIRRAISKFTPESKKSPVIGDNGFETNMDMAQSLKMGSQPNLMYHNSSLSSETLDYSIHNKSMPNLGEGTISSENPASILKTNYFRCQTQFVYALNAISTRILQVPKEARQSALQVELALLNEDLPRAEVDLPMLLPRRSGKQNRIVKICVSEATVLNSAEKAPFLLLIEYIRNDLTFDPQQPRNREVLRCDPKLKTHIFERPTLSENRLSLYSTGLQNTASESKSEGQADTDSSADTSPSGGAQAVESSEYEVDISELGLLEREENGLIPPSSNGINPSGQLPIAPTELNAASQVHESRQFAEGPSAADMATQWRTASLILAQLDGSTKLPKQEVQAIRQRIVSSMQAMKSGPRKFAGKQGEAGERRLENDLKTSGLAVHEDEDEEDPSAANLGEDWQARKARIRRASKFGNHPNWDLVSVIVKTGDDLRQEALASQLIQRAAQIWKAEEVGVWVRRMMILITSANSGLVETITNALSLHSIKKALTTAQVNAGGDPRSIAQLTQHFELKFGSPKSAKYQRAVVNFVESLAAYSILCYILQIKDRHNGNILVDSEGHIIHIDFGFMLSNSPGSIGFEANTFKLTQEYVDLMGGVGSQHWELFLKLVVQAFLALRKHCDEFVSFMNIMGNQSTMPCFNGGAASTAQQLRQRFFPDMSEEEAKQALERLVWKSLGSFYTRLYDQYQMATQGIYN